MKLIAGLGNPGKQYIGTRHNIGFEVIAQLSREHNIPITRAKFRAHFGEGNIGGEKVLLIMPQTFMNLSGESIRDIVEFYKLGAEELAHDLIVIYDDTDLEPGHIRVRERGSAGGHNGMKNIIYQLETDLFPRVRVGIGRKPPQWVLADYVLSHFSKNEHGDIIQGIQTAADAVTMIVKEGAPAAMNRYNRREEEQA